MLNELEEAFEPELASIQHRQVKNAVIFIIRELAHKEIVFMPSSSTGTHHPPDERVLGGWVMHAKRVFTVCCQLARLFDLPAYEVDVLVASALVHDLYQYGDSKKTLLGQLKVRLLKTDVSHAARLAEAITGSEILVSCNYAETIVLREIAEAVRWHSGRWGSEGDGEKFSRALASVWSGGGQPPPKMGFILHLADFIASRDNVVVDISYDHPAWEKRVRWPVKQRKVTALGTKNASEGTVLVDSPHRTLFDYKRSQAKKA